MPLRLVLLTAANSYLLGDFELTPGPEPWVSEAELAVIGELSARAVTGSGDTTFLAYTEGDQLVAAGVIGIDHRWPFATCVRGMFVEVRFRGKGYGKQLLTGLVDAAAANGAPHVVWLVHNANKAMQQLSSAFAADMLHSDGEYSVFVHP